VTLGTDKSALDSSLVTVVNSSTMTVVVMSKTYLTAPGSVAITAQNGSDTPTSAALLVTTDPIIYAVTSSASYQQQSPGGTPNVARTN